MEILRYRYLPVLRRRRKFKIFLIVFVALNPDRWTAIYDISQN